jgi:hypothetical protein
MIRRIEAGSRPAFSAAASISFVAGAQIRSVSASSVGVSDQVSREWRW